MDRIKQLEEYIQQHWQEFQRDLKKLVAIDSAYGTEREGKPYGDGPADALDAFLNIARGYGFPAENWDYQVGVISSEERPDRALDIVAHLDVVPAGDGWTKTTPFDMKEMDGRLYGRGTADDKGPALAALYAMRAIRDLGWQLDEGVRLVVGCNEERGGSDMEYYFGKAGFAPMTFSPDGDFPVINIEKGRLKGVATADIPEPESEAIREIRGGIALNVVPAVCTAVVRSMDWAQVAPLAKAVEQSTGTQVRHEEREDGTLELTVCGVSAHASTPEGGNNAVTAMLELLSALPVASSPLAERIRSLHRLFPHGDREGRAVGLFMADEMSGNITCSLDLIRYENGVLSASFDSRTPLCANEENLSIAGENLKKEGFHYTSTRAKSHYVPEDSPLVQALLASYESGMGKPGYCIAIGGGTYVHSVPNGVAFGCAVEGVDNHMHGPDEFAEIAVLKKSSIIFADAILRLCRR